MRFISQQSSVLCLCLPLTLLVSFPSPIADKCETTRPTHTTKRARSFRSARQEEVPAPKVPALRLRLGALEGLPQGSGEKSRESPIPSLGHWTKHGVFYLERWLVLGGFPFPTSTLAAQLDQIQFSSSLGDRLLRASFKAVLPARGVRVRGRWPFRSPKP